MRVIAPDRAMLDAAAEGDEALAAALGCPVAPGWAGFPQAVARAQPGRWATRFFVDEELVGWGGFKGPPQDGSVELGYAIAPERQGRGLATAAVEAMLREAFTDPAVDAVVAHTLPERNASVRVLEKAGFGYAGDAVESGRAVWRWVRAR